MQSNWSTDLMANINSPLNTCESSHQVRRFVATEEDKRFCSLGSSMYLFNPYKRLVTMPFKLPLTTVTIRGSSLGITFLSWVKTILITGLAISAASMRRVSLVTQKLKSYDSPVRAHDPQRLIGQSQLLPTTGISLIL